MVPEDVRDALFGQPPAGTWDEMVELLTVDEHGHPHVCLLSRSELDADSERLHASVAARGTIANLRRSGAATLALVLWDEAIYLKLDVTSLVEDDGWLGVSFLVRSVKRDGIGVPLTPARYLVTEELATTESWERSSRLLDRLRTNALEGTLS